MRNKENKSTREKIYVRKLAESEKYGTGRCGNTWEKSVSSSGFF